MTVFARIRTGAILLASAVLGLCVLVSGVTAQGSGGPPGIDHYKVYLVNQPQQPPTRTVFLRDQFGLGPSQVFRMEKFATPAVKDGFPLFDPITHYDWWRINPVPFSATVFATNQFGAEQELHLKQSEYLLTPSLKFPQPGQVLPLRNHYRCYSVDGPSPARLVTVQDQFGFNQAFVDSARMFCTPVEKQDPTGFYPILDPEAHLTCYDIHKTPPTQVQTVVVQDQFGFWDIIIVQDQLLCVPTFKTGVVEADHKTWGELKAIYR